MNELKVGIIGCGFVGGAVMSGFDVSDVKIKIVDPAKTQLTNEQLVEWQPHVIFVCVPTPQSDTGEVNASIVEKVLAHLDDLAYNGIVVIKSTVTPDHLESFCDRFSLRLIYNPEFLTEANANEDFINPSMQIYGGDYDDCTLLDGIYRQWSNVKVSPTFFVDIKTASLLKYTINSYLATKVVFMNEINKLFEQCSTENNWREFTDMLSRDPRIGPSHLKVPGPDGNYGFGGHCFPKDTKALLAFAQKNGIQLTVLEQAVNTNLGLRDDVY